MIRLRYILDSIIARKVSASEFLHSLDPKQTLGAIAIYPPDQVKGGRSFQKQFSLFFAMLGKSRIFYQLAVASYFIP